MTQGEKNFLVVLLGFIAAIGPFTIDTYLPAFESIAKDLVTDETMVTLTLTSYFIGITLGQLFYGPILDKYGRKNPMLIGFAIYAVAAIGAALSTNVYALIISRFVMALGACAGIVSSSAIVRDSFGPKEFARVMSSIVLVMGVAPVIAPTLGSWILEVGNWRMIFVFLAILATVIGLVIFFFYEDAREPDRSVSLKFNKVLKGYKEILTNRTFTLYTFARSFSMSIMFAYIASISFILMNIYEVSNVTFGWMFGLNALGFVLGSQFNKLLLKRYELHPLTFNIALIQAALVMSILVLASIIELPIYIFAAFTFAVLFFVGIINPNTASMALAPFEKNAGSASALTGSILMGVGALVSAMIGKFYNGTIFPLLFAFLALCVVGCVIMFYAKDEIDEAEEILEAELVESEVVE
ncbi:MAG: multidrug effflux MFS transporter [Flavobacteriales bacterium]|nr:multidrug effflux MFS transporter [Flavobacteriales bacterium]